MTDTPPGPPMDADVRALADQIAAILPSGLSGLGVEGVRQFGAQLDAQAPEPPQVFSVTEHEADGQQGSVRVRLYRPQSSAAIPVLLYIHGGGWTFGSIDGGIDYLCRSIVERNAIAVASIDYRLAPEHKFPAAIEDVSTALEWLRNNATELRIDPSNIAVGGDSAGGNLSAAITHLDRGAEPPLAAQVLLYPATEYMVPRPSWTENAEAPVLTSADTAWFWDQYLCTPDDQHDVRAVPATATDFANLPPALVIVAGHDPLRDDGLHYASLLDGGGTPTRSLRLDGTVHGFIAVPGLQSFEQGLDAIATFLHQALRTTECGAVHSAATE